MKKIKILSLLFAAICLLPASGYGGGEKRPLYPALLQCWEKGPLVKENFSTPSGRYYASSREINFYKRLFRELKDPNLRATLARELAQLENPDLGEIFFPFFVKEKDPGCRKAFLNTLEIWSQKGIRIPAFPPSLREELRKAGDPALKSAFIALSLQENYPLSLSRLLEDLNWKRDLESIGRLLTARKKLIGDRKKEYVNFLRKKEQSARLFGLALLWDATEEPDKEPLFRERLTGKDSLIYRLFLGKLIASSPKKAPELLRLLAADKLPAVQLVLAENMIPHTGEKEAFLAENLQNGEFTALRTASAKALGKGKTPRSLTLLLNALHDPDPILRRTAREALIERNPAPAFRKKIADEVRLTPNAYKEGAAFFAALPDKNIAGPFFARLLQEKKHPRIMLLHALQGLESIGVSAYAPIAASYASSPSPAVRLACAKALGKMKNPKAVPALKRLLLDRDPATAAQAYVTLWQWGESLPFAGEIRKTLRLRNDSHSFARAGAMRCASRLPESSFKPLLRDLETLMLKECIVIPMLPKSFDVEEVRLSALMVLKGRKEAAAKQLFRKGLAQLEKEAKDPDKGGGEGTSLFEFIRQIKVDTAGKKVIPSPVPDGKGIFSITPL